MTAHWKSSSTSKPRKPPDVGSHCLQKSKTTSKTILQPYLINEKLKCNARHYDKLCNIYSNGATLLTNLVKGKSYRLPHEIAECSLHVSPDVKISWMSEHFRNRRQNYQLAFVKLGCSEAVRSIMSFKSMQYHVLLSFSGQGFQDLSCITSSLSTLNPCKPISNCERLDAEIPRASWFVCSPWAVCQSNSTTCDN